MPRKREIPPSPRFAKAEGVKKSGLSAGQECLQIFTNAVIWEAKVTRLCNEQ